MGISKKRAPAVEDAQLSRVINGIYKDINELIDSINKGETVLKPRSDEGKPGDIRINKGSKAKVNADGTFKPLDSIYRLEIKGEDGWLQSIDSIEEISLVIDELNSATFTGSTVETSAIPIDVVNALDGVTFTGSEVETSEIPHVDQLEACIGVLAGKINGILTVLREEEACIGVLANKINKILITELGFKFKEKE
jgi:hypothetical protein